jgi:guanine deaminase
MEPCIYYAPILNPKTRDSADWFPDGALAVDAEGRIMFAGERADMPERYLQLPCKSTDWLMVPGFVDTHIHLPQYDCRGKFGVSLMDWLQSFIFKEEARFADLEVARDMAARFFSGLVSAGTTTAMVFSSVHEASTSVAFEEAERSRLRIIMGKVQMDRNVPDALCETRENSTAATRRLIERWHRSTDRLWYAVTPRFAPSCTMELMRESAGIAARNDVYVQTHINESPEEVRMVLELFPGCRHYTDVYEQAGLLGPKTVLAHNIHVSEDELDRCEELRCAVAHCPDSNLFLGSGRFPIEKYRGRSIRIGLGSDVGAGTTVSMLQVMRSMTHVQGASMHPFIPLYHATLGGARALSLEQTTGNLETGKQADFLLVDVGDRFAGGKKISHQRALEIASVLVYRANDQDVKEVYVGGEKLYSSNGI